MGPPTLTLTQHDWSLHRKGPVDQARHNEKVKEVIRENLPAIIGEEAIIKADGDRIVKVPIRSLELPRFRFGESRNDHVGQGPGGSRPGDVLGQQPNGNGAGKATGAGAGKGATAGQEPGIDYYEAELTVDELAALVFEDLGLPFLEPRGERRVETEAVRFDDVRRRGVLANLDKRRTIMENLRRNARAGTAGFGGLADDDLRFRTWEPKIAEENNAVVVAMRDVSGSMGDFEKYITRSFYFWMVRFLRTKYDSVEIVFITHHTEAKEVDEDAFFNLGESGGTKVSSAYKLALDIVKERYSPTLWNVYAFHFSDGDNWGDVDNQRCVQLMQGLLEVVNAFGYGEIRGRGGSPVSMPTTLMSAFAPIASPRFIRVTIASKGDVYPALQKFFSTQDARVRAP